MISHAETPLSSPEQPPHIETLAPIGYERVIAYADNELSRIAAPYTKLHQARMSLYGDKMSASALYSPDGSLTVAEQLYIDVEKTDETEGSHGSSYNSLWTKADLRLRKGNAEFHEEDENLNDLESDTPERRQQKQAYRQEIIEATDALGNYTTRLKPGVSSSPLEQRLGMRESELSPDTPLVVDTVVVPAAAALSNHMRAWDTIRDLDSGALVSDNIVFATGERAVTPAQKKTVEAKEFRPGETEYEAMQYALEDLLGISIESIPSKQMKANYGSATRDIFYKQFNVSLGGKDISITILEAAYDRDRRLEGNAIPDRANTDETFYAALPFLSKEAKTVAIKSHDAWIPYQEVIGNKVFGLYADVDVIATGPYKDNRVFERPDGSLDMNDAQGVVDEIGKKADDLVKLRVLAENAKANYELSA